jgi:hypothetical protein
VFLSVYFSDTLFCIYYSPLYYKVAISDQSGETRRRCRLFTVRVRLSLFGTVVTGDGKICISCSDFRRTGMSDAHWSLSFKLGARAYFTRRPRNISENI